jgi:peptidyl-prolyl cis-trans isomerase B (cyclophilin B)
VQRLYETSGGAPMLDGEYTVFGQLISGFDVLDKIAATPTNPNDDRPQQDVKIIRCTILP